MAGDGATDRAFEKDLFASIAIDEETVKMHRDAMLDGLGVPTSAEAIRLALEAEL